MTEIYLAFGANLGNPAEMAEKVLDSLKKWDPAVRSSRYYRTSPWEMQVDAPPFLNAVFSLETSESLEVFWQKVCQLEKDLGKIEKPKDASRHIDLDLIFFGNQIYESEHLKVPHRHWKERFFVVKPLFDLTESVLIGGEWIRLRPILKQLMKDGRGSCEIYT